MKIYFLSGLGADETVFYGLQLPGVERIYLDWMEPLPKESIEQYAGRMAARITEPNPIIIGLSFGGMMAMEIAKLIPVQQLILISSAKTRKELPPYFAACSYVPLHKLLPLHTVAYSDTLMGFFFGVRTNTQRAQLKKIIRNTTKGFNQWAINALVNWKNQQINAPVFHIHGNADKLLPLSFVKPDIVIEGGNHFMVFQKAKEISEHIQQVLLSDETERPKVRKSERE
ncbi:MAG: alpha/beta hydrolase [Bacteroidota bacterium]